MSATGGGAALEAFGERVRAALGAPGERTLASMFPAAAVTALVVDAAELAASPRVVRALLEVRDALERIGVPRGRQFVLAGRQSSGAAPVPRERLAPLRQRLALAVFAHEPSAAAFAAGALAAGARIELDDELREAEAIVCVGAGAVEDGRVAGGPYLLVPGVASLATRRALEARRTAEGERGALDFALAAETLAPVDLAVLWGPAGQVIAGPGRALFAGFAPGGRFA